MKAVYYEEISTAPPGEQVAKLREVIAKTIMQAFHASHSHHPVARAVYQGSQWKVICDTCGIRWIVVRTPDGYTFERTNPDVRTAVEEIAGIE